MSEEHLAEQFIATVLQNRYNAQILQRLPELAVPRHNWSQDVCFKAFGMRNVAAIWKKTFLTMMCFISTPSTPRGKQKMPSFGALPSSLLICL